MPVLRHQMGGTSWAEALIDGGTEILVIDFLLLAMGLLLLRKARPAVSDRDMAPITPIQEPAE